MRTQRRTPVTVVLLTTTRTDDNGLGDYTEITTETTIEGCTFEPQQIVESVDPDQPAIVQPAFFNLPGVHDLDADDLLRVGDGDDAETWQVVGGATVWLDRTKVPVKRTGAR